MNTKDLVMIGVAILVPGGLVAAGIYAYRRIRDAGWAFAPNVNPRKPLE